MNDEIKQTIMRSIRSGDLHMRPRWHFILKSALFALGVLIFVLALAYAVSLVVFFLERSGAWFVPAFGGRGWIEFFRSIPWLLIILIALFAIVLEILVRRYSFAYRKSILTTGAVVLAIVFVGGFVISLTPLHRDLEIIARRHLLPEPLGSMYRPPFRMRDESIFRGVVASSSGTGIAIVDRNGGTTTVLITNSTRLPYGRHFEEGTTVVVVGDRVATGTVQAFGIRDIAADPESPSPMK